MHSLSQTQHASKSSDLLFLGEESAHEVSMHLLSAAANAAGGRQSEELPAVSAAVAFQLRTAVYPCGLAPYNAHAALRLA